MKTFNQFVDEGVLTSIGRKKPEKKAEKAMDAGARAKRKLARKVHAKYVSGSEDNVPDDIRESEELSELSKRTLGNYVKDASSDAAMTSMTHGNKPLAKDAPKREKKILKRLSGIRKATDKLSKEEVVHEGDYHSGQGEKIQKRTKAWMDKKGQKGAPGLDAMKARTAEHKAKRGVKEEVDAYKYVVAKLKKKHGSGVLTKGDKIKPQSAADKAKARAHQAKVDAENAAERKKDPSQGRYPKGYSNRGSD